ncbi:MAG: hypothetical protein ACOC53_05630 [Candidatus Saliniplasma sp.]
MSWYYGFNLRFRDYVDTDGLTNQDEADVHGTDPLSPDTDGDGVCDLTELTGAVTRYVADHGEKGYKFYTSWEEIKEDHGMPDKTFSYATNPINSDTDFDGLNDSMDPIPKDYDMNGDGRINHVDLVDETSPYYVERIARAAKNDPWIDRDEDGELIESYDMSGDGVSNDEAEDMSRDGMPTEYEREYGVKNGGWQHPYLHNARYAVLLGSGSMDEDRNYPGYWNDIYYLYEVLTEDYNYIEENVHLLYSEWDGVDHSNGNPAVNDNASLQGLERSLEIVRSRITTNDFFLFAYRGHASDPEGEKEKKMEGYTGYSDGDKEKDVEGDSTLILAPEPPRWSLLNYSELNDILEDIDYNRMGLLLGTCFSGIALDHLSSEDRIIMTSAESDENSYATLGTAETGAFFYEGIHRSVLGDNSYPGLVKNLGDYSDPSSLDYAFSKGYAACRKNYSSLFGVIVTDARSTPQINNKILASNTYL